MRSRRAPSFSIAVTVAPTMPVKAPFQPECAAPMTPRLAVGEQDRPAIGAGDAERDAGRARRPCASAFGRSPGHGPVDDDHVGRMDLVEADQMRRLDHQMRRHARPVLGDRRGIVVRAEPAIERGIDAGRDAALAREEGVADAGLGGEIGSVMNMSVVRSCGGVSPALAADEGQIRAAAAEPGCDSARTLNNSPMPVAPRSVRRSKAAPIACGLLRRRPARTAPARARRARAPAGSRPASTGPCTARARAHAPPAPSARNRHAR